MNSGDNTRCWRLSRENDNRKKLERLLNFALFPLNFNILLESHIVFNLDLVLPNKHKACSMLYCKTQPYSSNIAY